MRVSVKARYALAATVYLSAKHGGGESLSAVSIAERLGISKIYLEQIFSTLRRAELITAIKGPQGGYKLARSPEEITAYDILFAADSALFERAGDTVEEKAPALDAAIQTLVFDRLDEAVTTSLKSATLAEIAAEAQTNRTGQIMFYI